MQQGMQQGMPQGTPQAKEVKRIQTIGLVMRVVMTILSVLTFIGAFFALVGAIVFAVFPESWLTVTVSGELDVSVSSTFPGWEKLLSALSEDLPDAVTVNGEQLYVSLAAGKPIELPVSKLISLAVLAGALQAAVYGVVFLLIGKFGKVLQKNSTPFSQPCIRYLKVTAFVLLGWSLLSAITGRLLCAFLFGQFLTGISVDIGMIFVSLLLLLLAYIFQYGAKLQQESDETF